MISRARFCQALTVMAVIGLFAARPGLAADPIVIGQVTAITGPGAPYGIPARDIVKILIDRLNAAGGVNGHKLELVMIDDRTDPTEAARGAMRMIRENKVQAILETSTGSSTLAMMPMAAQAKIPVLASIATESFTDKSNAFYPYAFRMCPPSSAMAEAMFNLAVVKAGRKRVGLFYNEDAHGKEEAEFERGLAKRHPGVEIVGSASAAMSAIDLTAQATRLRNDNPDVVLAALSSVAVGSGFVRAAKQVGLQAQIAGSVLLQSQAFLDGAGPAANGVLIAAFSNWDDPTPKQAELGKIMKAAGMAPAGWSEVLAAGGVMTLVEAIRHVDGDVTGEKIRDALEQIHNFDGTPVSGALNYSKDNHEGFGSDNVILLQVQDGKLKTLQ